MDNDVTPSDWESQLIDYTLGVMGPDEAAAFEADLEECRRNVKLAREYGVVAGWLGTATTPSEPPAGHKSRLMARVQSTPQLQPTSPVLTQLSVQSGRPSLSVVRPEQPTTETAPATEQALEAEPSKVTDLSEYRAKRSSTAVLQALLGVAALLIFLLGLWGWTANSDKMTAQQQVNALITQVNVPAGYQVLPLAAQKDYTDVTAIALYNPTTKDVTLVASKLPILPAGKVYEFWFLKAQGNPDPAGTFVAAQTGTATHQAQAPQTMAGYAGFAVSEEPSPGGPVPTGPIIAAGTYSTP